MTAWTVRCAGWNGIGTRICARASKPLSYDSMNVAISIDELRAERVWYDASTGKLFIQAKDFVNGVKFTAIPEEDFESSSPVTSFSLRHKGATVICHHQDGKETWLPVDMWLPEGFSPRGDRKSTRLNSSHLGISYAV